MKVVSLIFLLLMSSAFAQKKVVENKDYYWKSLKGINVSNNGQFLCYFYSDSDGSAHLVIHNVKNFGNADTIHKVGSAEFAGNGGLLLFKQGDTLVEYDLVKKGKSYEQDVLDWKLIEFQGKNFLLFKRRNHGLNIQDLSSGRKKELDSVKSYILDSQSGSLAIVTNAGLSLLSLATFQQKKMASFDQVSGIVFGPQAKKVFFYTQDDGKTAYVYDLNKAILRKLFSEADVPAAYAIGVAPQFTVDGKRLVFTFDKKEVILPEQVWGYIPKMAIWHPDLIAPPNAGKGDLMFQKVIAWISTESVDSSLRTIATGWIDNVQVSADPDKLFFVRKYEAGDRLHYKKDKFPDHILYNMKDGLSVSYVPKNHILGPFGGINYSSTFRFAYWYDESSSNHFCYDSYTGNVVNTTKDIFLPKDMRMVTDNAYYFHLDPIPAWIDADRKFIIRDKFDLWQVDPTGLRKPICLTGGYGRKYGVKFYWLGEEMNKTELRDGKKIVITAQNEQDKKNGYASIVIGSNEELKMGVLKDQLFAGPWAGQTTFKRSKSNHGYFVIGRKASESPNLYYTKDLNTFSKISDIHPESDYNWLTSSLIHYPMQAGKTGTAIVYKPENFDATKKYPILFTYYQKRSDGVHEYFVPGLDVNINIPFYASNGYVVVVPDIINDEPGQIAKTTVNSVVSAVEYLKQYPWFDSSKMGLQGQSFGGYETNILVANTNLFAAAQASDGRSNLAVFGQGWGASSMIFAERGQPNLNTTLWEHPEVYIKNSPIFQADKVTTPLLLLHGRKDTAVDFNQGENMFYAMKRNGKPVWLIEYEGGDHANFGDGYGSQDFNIRRQQFFDHYLKGAPMPMWMKEAGNLSLELDTAKKNN